MKVAVIGLGNMGARMARRLLNAGFELGVADLNTQVVNDFVELGAKSYSDLAALGADTDVVITVLPDAQTVKSAVLGEQGLQAGMRPGCVLVDMTSSEPMVTREIAAALSKAQVAMIDAPVSGGVSKAQDGTLTMMVGGDKQTFEQVRPVLAHLGQTMIHVGEIGAGHTAKALNNLVTATTLSITAEAMALGVKMGVDAAKMLEVINNGSGASAASQMKFAQQILSGKFERGFTVSLMAKDVGVALGMAQQQGVPLSLSSTVHALWKAGVAAGHGDEDHTAIARYIENLAQVELRAP